MPTLNELLHDARWHPHWRWLLLVLAAISAYFAFSADGPPMLVVPLDDKIHHLAAFAAMGLAAALARRPSWRHMATAQAGLVVFGAFIEAVQSQLPTRQADVADLLADALGTMAGLIVVAVMRRIWRSAAS